ncbi:MAG TPA: histidine kinase dimerization/phosphoacceptor domain -containing protein [Prolixibacteraceae bacterium]|nr:histidine kinase dimerization/phosphoacceptor domain -containing protein [Prolixibacteraceae bacterium]
MKLFFQKWFLKLALCASFPLSAQADVLIENSASFKRPFSINDHLVIYEDSTREKTIDEIRSSPELFQALTEKKQKNPLGIYWLKFDLIHSSAGHSHLSLLYRNLTFVEVFEFRDDTLCSVHKTGLFRKNSELSPGDEPDRVTMILNPGERIQVFIRVEHIKGYKPSIHFFLQNEESALSDELRLEQINYLILGGFLIFCLYSLIIFFFTRIRSYLWLSLFSFNSAFYGFSIAGNILSILGETPELAWRLNPVLANLSGISGFLLINSFLGLKQYSPRLSKMIHLFIGILFFQIVLSQVILQTLQDYQLMTNLNIFSLFLYFPVIVSIPLKVWKKLDRPQKLMSVMAFIYAFTLVAVFFMLWFRKEDALQNIFWISNLILLLVIAFFTVSLSERMRMVEIERNEILTELSRIKDEQNRMLEEMVDERTRMLSDANYVLEVQKNILEKRNARIELLLKELHHRVKNNLQLFSSFYELSVFHGKEKDLVKIVEEGQARIKIMALVHDMLYQGNQEKNDINMESYLKQIGEYLRTFVKTRKKVEIGVSCPGIFFDLDTALPLGLIANELIINTLKHCKTKEPSIRILLSIVQNRPGHYLMAMSDNGFPLDQNQIASKPESFGLKMISILSRQLNGDFRFEFEQNNTFLVSFMDSESRKSIL